VTTDEPDWIRDVLSRPRFAPYLRRSGDDVTLAIELYRWNIAVSAAFFAPIHWLELALRNSLHQRLTAAFGRDDWWTSAPLADNSKRMVDDACRNLGPNAAGPPADQVVAQLSFGFWVGLTARRYDRSLWVRHLHKAFPHYRGPRGPLHSDLQTMLLFRNRIMHHEPIHHRHLAADHDTMTRVLAYLSPEACTQLATHDDVLAVLRRRPDLSEGGRA
jgi:hypothetical protein